ncbi:MAG: hypothetical protein VYA84_06730 [Planctomycetota bacterium]|nr:hypothetical protein [Planctomycetota bacterium]
MKRLQSAFGVAIALCYTTAVQAHPGHGNPGSTHYWTEPEHLVALGIVATFVTTLCIGKYCFTPNGRKSSV